MWVARNQSGTLVLFEDMPHREVLKYIGEKDEEALGYWEGEFSFDMCKPYEADSMMLLEQDQFDSLKWENEPLYCVLRTPEKLNEIRDKVYWNTKEHCEKYTIDLLAEYLSDEYGLDKTELEESIKQFYKGE